MKFALFSKFQEGLAEQQENLLLWVPVFLGLGSALYFLLASEPSHLLTGGVLAGAISFLIWAFRLYRHHHDSGGVVFALATAMALLCVVTGFAAAQIKTDYVATPMLRHETRPVEVTAILDHRENQEGGKGILLFLKDVRIENWDKAQTPSMIRVTSRKMTEAGVGDKISFLAKLTPLSPPVAPKSYDFARHYYFEGIGALGYSLSDITIEEKGRSGFFNLSSLRAHISAYIDAHVDERQRGIVSALMTGERAAIADEDWAALRASGLAHIISISGLHVVMVAAPVFFIVRFCLALIPFVALRFPIKKIAALVALIVCSLYVGLVVPSVPTTRALLMTGVGLIAIMLDRSPFSLRLVAFSAILVLIFSPESIWSVSFQMSFAAVTALVAAAEWARPAVSEFYNGAGWIKRGVLFVAGTLLTSLVASIATAPFSLYHFQQIASYSVVANALSVPISGIMIMPMVIISFLLMPFDAAGWSLSIMAKGVEWLLDISVWVQNIPGSILTTRAVPDSFLVLITMAGLSLILMKGVARYTSVLFCLMAIVAAVFSHTPDIVVSDDAKLLAVRDKDHIYASSLRQEKFALQTWLKRWNRNADSVMPFPKEGGQNLADGGFISCDMALCRIEKSGYKISFGNKYYELKKDCAWADILITPNRLPDDFCGKDVAIPRLWGHREIWRNGAMSLTLDKSGRPTIRTVGNDRGLRPWSGKTDQIYQYKKNGGKGPHSMDSGL